MKIVRVATFFSMLLFSYAFAMGCNNDLPEEIFKHWIHSHEEDTKDIMVFRPEYYNFPRSRGRTGFEIKENGEFIQYKSGPTDRPVKTTGHWKAEGKNKIIVYFEKKETEPYTITIISSSNDVLKLKK